jgi:transcription antitermination factor NusG
MAEKTVDGLVRNGRKWYVLYTRPRWEKKVNLLLADKGFEGYCPLNKVRRKWSDRYKTVEEPLFKSYVFVHAEQSQLTALRAVPGVLNFVYWNGKPAIVREKEIIDIKKFLNEYAEVTALPIDLKPRMKVVITSGILMDKTAEVLDVGEKMIEVVIESLGYKLVAKIDRRNLTPAD